MDKTLLKGLLVLDFVAQTEEGARIIDVSNTLGLNKSNAYRVLQTLQHAGYIRQNHTTKVFKPTLKLWELGSRVLEQTNLKSIAGLALRELAIKSRETVHLSVLDGNDVIYLEKIDSIDPMGNYTRMGGRAPAFCVATGKALLSCLAPHIVEQRFRMFERYSPSTITDIARLQADLKTAAELGYATNRGEWNAEIWGIASPVIDSTGSAVAAVGVSGPRFRFEDEKLRVELGSMVKATAADISKILGGFI